MPPFGVLSEPFFPGVSLSGGGLSADSANRSGTLNARAGLFAGLPPLVSLSIFHH